MAGIFGKVGQLGSKWLNNASGASLLANNPEAAAAARRYGLLGFGAELLSPEGNIGTALSALQDRGLKGGLAAQEMMLSNQQREARKGYFSDNPDLLMRYSDAISRAFAAGDTQAVKWLTETAKAIAGGQNQGKPTYKTGLDPEGKQRMFAITGAQAAPVEGMTPTTDSSNDESFTGARWTLFEGEDGLPYGKWVRRGETPPGRPWTAPTEASNRAGFFADTLRQNNKLLDDATAPNRLEQFADRFKLNEFLSTNREQFFNAGLSIIDTYLRITTGAAYNREEMRTAASLLTPMPGDNDDTLKRKAEMRRLLASSVERIARGARWTPGNSGLSPDLLNEITRIQGTSGTPIPGMTPQGLSKQTLDKMIDAGLIDPNQASE